VFRPDEVERWEEPITTPSNVDSYRWILEIAREAIQDGAMRMDEAEMDEMAWR
jgi:hypothetical protein